MDLARPSMHPAVTPIAASPFNEQPVVFGESSEPLVGVLHLPSVAPRQVVMIVPGGSQNRVGNGRQFVSLARHLAAQGIGALRFDYSGIGDSAGPLPHFESALPSLLAAATYLSERFPQAHARVSWGLCDGATAALLHAAVDHRIVGVVAANPWARSPGGQSQALLRTHYLERLKSRDFWGRLMHGQIEIGPSVREAVGHLVRSLRARPGSRIADLRDAAEPSRATRLFDPSVPLPDRIALAMRARPFDALVMISTKDLTGAECDASLGTRGAYRRPGVVRLGFDSADHVFSSRQDWQRVLDETTRWVRSL